MVTKKTVTTNLIWRFLERGGAQGVTFIVSIILARILDPKVYGAIALVSVFTSILGIFIDSGLGCALIQKKDADDLDFSSVFYFNFLMCLVLYAIMFVSAPFIARFYEMEELTSVIRVMSLLLVIGGIKNIQISYVSKNLIFKKFFFATLGGTIGAAILGIYMAFKGYGIWALVVQNLFNNLVDTVILWITVKWRPKLMFSWNRLKSLFGFGWKLLMSAIIDNVYNNLRQLIIGKMYQPSDLAFYNKGDSYPRLLVSNLNSSIDSVLLPTMAEQQDNLEHLKNMTRRAITVSTYVMMPMMMGLAVCAEPLIRLILTEKWLPAVPYLRIFCFTYAFYPIHTSNLNAIKALGRSDIFLKLEILKKIVGMIALLSTMWFGVIYMAYSLLVTCILNQIINSWPNKKLLNYSYAEQVKDMMPQILLSVLMGFAVLMENYIPVDDTIKLLIQVPTGVVVYVIGSKLFKIPSYCYIIDMIKNRRNK